MEAALEEQMLNLFPRFLERVRLRRSKIIRLGSQPDNLLVHLDQEILKRLTIADMRNDMKMMAAKHESAEVSDLVHFDFDEEEEEDTASLLQKG
ncbi:hypothetical protein Tco_1346686 [Tanacetum coccineum]